MHRISFFVPAITLLLMTGAARTARADIWSYGDLNIIDSDAGTDSDVDADAGTDAGGSPPPPPPARASSGGPHCQHAGALSIALIPWALLRRRSRPSGSQPRPAK